VITFNDVLESAGIDPGMVLLARHHDHRSQYGSIYELWKRPNGPAVVEEYQRIQRLPRFKSVQGGGSVASFVVTPGKETLFVGLYAVGASTTCPPGQRDPITGEDITGYTIYQMDYDDRLGMCREHLCIEWGPAYRTWVQQALPNPKPVLHAPPGVLANLAEALDEGAEVSGSEGRLYVLRHRLRERDARLRERKVDAVRRGGGSLSCEVCRFDFEETYGERGRGFIESHHIVPLHETGERTTRLDDLALLCANCHRMVQRSPWLAPGELRDLMRS
jgi:hypothetical protein